MLRGDIYLVLQSPRTSCTVRWEGSCPFKMPLAPHWCLEYLKLWHTIWICSAYSIVEVPIFNFSLFFWSFSPPRGAPLSSSKMKHHLDRILDHVHTPEKLRHHHHHHQQTPIIQGQWIFACTPVIPKKRGQSNCISPMLFYPTASPKLRFLWLDVTSSCSCAQVFTCLPRALLKKYGWTF